MSDKPELVTYRVRDSTIISQAWIDPKTGDGVINDRFPIPVQLAWSGEEQRYIQVDPWSWIILPDDSFMLADEFYARMEKINPKPKFQRVQPKRLTRAQRLRKKK